jgi:hypothetical protein
MARTKGSTKSTAKRGNGEGDSITITFDIHDRTERRALQMSKLLASKHGRRKEALISMLATMYDVFEQTGEILDSRQIAALLSGGTTSTSASAPNIGFTQAVARAHGLPANNVQGGLNGRQAVAIEAAPAKTTAAQISSAFLGSAGAAFLE